MIISAHIVDRREKSKVGLFIFLFFFFLEEHYLSSGTSLSSLQQLVVFFFEHLRTEAKVKTQSFL